jgi:hypothetical protein
MRVDNEVRTRDLDLGKVALYQLSYVHMKESQSARNVSFRLAAFQRVKTLYDVSPKFQIDTFPRRHAAKILVIPRFLTGPKTPENSKTSPGRGKIFL